MSLERVCYTPYHQCCRTRRHIHVQNPLRFRYIMGTEDAASYIVLAMIFISLLSAILIQFVSASPLAKRDITGPLFSADFKDPSFVRSLQSSGSAAWIAFSSSSGGLNVPTAQGASGFGPWTLRGVDALPTVGAWSTGNNVLSPDVIHLVRHTFDC